MAEELIVQEKDVETNVVRCTSCGCFYTKPTLIPQGNPYNLDSADDYFRQHDSVNKISQGESLADFAEKMLGKPGRILEIGCGRGELLVGAINRGWQAYGVEMTENFAQVAMSNGINVEISSVENCSSLDQSYDVILLAAVLEHLYQPMEILRRISSALNKGGLLFIDVPNEASLTMKAGNWYQRIRGRDWTINLSPTFSPYHVVGFSPATLQKALNMSGFKIIQIDIPKWNNAMPSGAGIIEKFEKKSLSIIQNIGASIGMGDGIACWAVKE